LKRFWWCDLRLKDLRYPFKTYGEHKRKICWTALIIIIAINILAFGIYYYLDNRTQKIADEIYDEAINEIERLNENHVQSDPNFPVVQSEDVGVVYDRSYKIAGIAITFHKDISEEIINEYAYGIASRVFNAISERSLETIEMECTQYKDMIDSDFNKFTIPDSHSYSFTRDDF
jgi:hypothetical protein